MPQPRLPWHREIGSSYFNSTVTPLRDSWIISATENGNKVTKPLLPGREALPP